MLRDMDMLVEKACECTDKECYATAGESVRELMDWYVDAAGPFDDQILESLATR